MAIKDNPNKRSPPWALGQVLSACNGNVVLTGLVIVLIIANVNLMGGIYNKRFGGGQQRVGPQPVRLQADSTGEEVSTGSVSGASSADAGGSSGMGLPVPKPWPYTCWEPKAGLSKPVVTIVTIAGGLDEYHPFLRRNRLHYAAAQGYRCVLTRCCSSRSLQTPAAVQPITAHAQPCMHPYTRPCTFCASSCFGQHGTSLLTASISLLTGSTHACSRRG
jgi:hypothetical protein